MGRSVKNIRRPDGTRIRIIARGTQKNHALYVLIRRGTHWHLTRTEPHLEASRMTVDQYIEHGRSEQMRTVSHGEVLQTLSRLPRGINGQTN